jgi:hypothetical protein
MLTMNSTLCAGPDSERDQTLITLYILTIVALLAVATFRDRVKNVVAVRALFTSKSSV